MAFSHVWPPTHLEYCYVYGRLAPQGVPQYGSNTSVRVWPHFELIFWLRQCDWINNIKNVVEENDEKKIDDFIYNKKIKEIKKNY